MEFKRLLFGKHPFEPMTQEQYYRTGMEGIWVGLFLAAVGFVVLAAVDRFLPPYWFEIGITLSIFASLGISLLGLRMCLKMRKVWRERGDARGFMNPTMRKRLYQWADLAVVVGSFVFGWLLFRLIYFWNTRELRATLLYVIVVVLVGGLVFGCIVFRKQTRRYWWEHPMSYED